ncbi:MAG TPA: hypothetical protein VLE73_04485 [Candidatus Saccharimonadales bacterium]|nr:hypothetical protein [Candidatus Saccharimonadales bacterium]
MSIHSNSALFSNPNNCAISIVGGNVIEHAVKTADPDSALANITPHQIADAIEEKVSILPTYTKPLATHAFAHSMVGGRPDRRVFGTQLAESPILDERFIGQAALRMLGNIPLPRRRVPWHAVSWIQFAVDCPEPLVNELITVTNDHIPPGTPMVFDRVRSMRQGDEKNRYLEIT